MSVITVGWRGGAVTLEGTIQALERLVARLPAFYERDTPELRTAAATSGAVGTVAVTGGLVSLGLPDGLDVVGRDTDETWRAAAGRLELAAVSRMPELVAVHAGVVAVAGRALVVPGRSMAGKSTLVRTLVGAGATYLSDEYALLTADGLVAAYPRPLSWRTPGTDHRTPVTLSPAAAATDPALPVGVVVDVAWASATWDVRPVSKAKAALALVANCVHARREPDRSMTVVARAVESAVTLAGTRGEAGPAAQALMELLVRR